MVLRELEDFLFIVLPQGKFDSGKCSCFKGWRELKNLNFLAVMVRDANFFGLD